MKTAKISSARHHRSPEVLEMAPEGGLAEKAGSASAVVNDKASRAAANVSAKVKPAAAEAAHKAGEAMNDGAYKLGVQLSKTKGMFSNFKRRVSSSSQWRG